MNLRSLYLNAIANALNEGAENILLGGFDEERKADTIHARRGEAYGFAYAVFREFPGNPIHGDEHTWDCVLRMFDRITEWMQADGTWSWYIPATGKTHRVNCHGGVFRWLRLLEDFGGTIFLGQRKEGALNTWEKFEAEIVATDRFIPLVLCANGSRGKATVWFDDIQIDEVD